jgi:aminopeptidase N
MENTTATTMYEHILLDERAALDVTSDDLIAHELAHQWFGDYVTCRAWYEGWLNEGFATFFEHVWREKHLGATSTSTGEGRSRRLRRRGARAATAGPSSARTTTRRSICSIATSTRRGGSCCTRSGSSSATRSSGGACART